MLGVELQQEEGGPRKDNPLEVLFTPSKGQVLAERDYSGVATAELKSLIERHVAEGERDAWAESAGIPVRTLKRVLDEDYQWTGLSIADKAATKLGYVVGHVLTIIPGATNLAAKRMATDELQAAAEVWELPAPTEAEIEQRAEELLALRIEVLGPPTQKQIARLSADAARTSERFARRQEKKRTAAETKVFSAAS